MVTVLGHVGIICDDLMKMRDFYTRVIDLTITDEDPECGSCFLSAAPEREHHDLNLGQARSPDHSDGARPRTQGLGQVAFAHATRHKTILYALFHRAPQERISGSRLDSPR